MKWMRALMAALLLVQPVAAQTVAGDRVRLNAAPCTIDSVDGTPDKLRLVDCSTVTTGGSSNLTLNPAGDLVLQPAGVDVLPGSGYTVNLGALTNKYLALHAAGGGIDETALVTTAVCLQVFHVHADHSSGGAAREKSSGSSPAARSGPCHWR